MYGNSTHKKKAPEVSNEDMGESFLDSKPLDKKQYFHKQRLTSSEIKLVLLLHFICNSKGIAKNIKKSHLAAELNISLKTVNRALCGLVREGIILIGNTPKGVLNFAITRYEDSFLKKKSSGYYPLSHSQFQSLLASENVQHLRADIYVLYKSDFNTSTDGAIAFQREDLLKVSPCIAYKKAMKKYAESKNNIGDKRYLSQGNLVRIYPNLQECGKAVLSRIPESIEKHVLPLLPGLSNKDKEDLYSLGKEYGYETLKDALYYFNINQFEYQKNTNLGALLRNHIDTYLLFTA